MKRRRRGDGPHDGAAKGANCGGGTQSSQEVDDYGRDALTALVDVRVDKLYALVRTGCASDRAELDRRIASMKAAFMSASTQVVLPHGVSAERRWSCVMDHQVRRLLDYAAERASNDTVADELPPSTAQTDNNGISFLPGWDNELRPEAGCKYVLADVLPGSEEFRFVSSFFGGPYRGRIRVQRVQNDELRRRYVLQRQLMRARGAGTEAFLFHGTHELSVPLICESNVDTRLNGRNGTVYGKGAYYARGFRTSMVYCTSRPKRMFLCKVMLGKWRRVGATSSSSRPTGSTPCATGSSRPPCTSSSTVPRATPRTC